MEGAQENPAESGSSVPSSEEPAGSAKVPEVSLSEESEGCTRPLEAVPKKLCGYLSKFGGKGPIRGWKSRWFFFDERKCHLYYSRTAQDANPLDSIDLSSAVFDCKADAEEGTFEIKTPNRIITLKIVGDEVQPFSLDEEFDYDAVVLTPKFTPAEMNAIKELSKQKTKSTDLEEPHD